MSAERLLPARMAGLRSPRHDSAGAVLHGVFTLVVHASAVSTPGNFGNEVNAFGNGFDVFRQHPCAYNAIIAGWPANNADPATLVHPHQPSRLGRVAVQESDPRGNMATGLCVSDPGYDDKGTGELT